MQCVRLSSQGYCSEWSTLWPLLSSNAMSGLASTLESRVTLTVQGSKWIATHILPYVRVSPYTEVTLTDPGPSMDSHCYNPPPMSEYPRTPELL